MHHMAAVALSLAHGEAGETTEAVLMANDERPLVRIVPTVLPGPTTPKPIVFSVMNRPTTDVPHTVITDQFEYEAARELAIVTLDDCCRRLDIDPPVMWELQMMVLSMN
jgi:hypothetical protein